jgi:hypothetical protein
VSLTVAQRGILGRMVRDNIPILAYQSRGIVNCIFPQGRHRLHAETVAALEQAEYIECADDELERWPWRYEITEAGRDAITN